MRKERAAMIDIPETTGHPVPWMETLESIREAASGWSPDILWSLDGGYVHFTEGKTFIRAPHALAVGEIYSR